MLFVLFAVPVICAAVVLAFRLPAIYLSEAKVLIEQPAIPEDIVASTINTYVDEQIEAVSQRVLAAENVSMIIREFDLYPEQRVGGIDQALIEQFRLETDLQNIAAEIFDARRGRMDGSTFAFVVGFRHTDPVIAQQVANRLVQLYLAENVKARTEISAETTLFLRQQAERVSADISQIEVKLADFKAQYSSSLPERLPFNIQMLDRVERDLEDTEDEIRQVSSEIDILTLELQSIGPYATMVSESGAPVLGAEERLDALQLEYMRLSSTYGPEHPDVIRTKREIDAILGSESLNSADEIALRLVSLRVERTQLLERYSSEHPDVSKIDRTIALLEDQQRSLGGGQSGRRPSMPAPNNPLYVQKQLQIEGAAARLRAAQNERQTLISRRSEVERNIAIAPTVEKEWLELNRGYSSLQDEYDQINGRISEAQMSETLESQNKGERFTLLEAATLPSQPIEPNRFAIIFLGVVVAIGAGIGLAAIMDGLDGSVRSGRDLEVILGTTPLVAIPFIETSVDRRSRHLRRFSVMTLVAISILAAVVSI
jgi:uncharacterized protein involved in exopolysaccharide biosynthesis